MGSNDENWPLACNGKVVGYVTSAVYSPRLKSNIALAMVAIKAAKLGTQGTLESRDGSRNFEVVPKPFYDPKKAIANSA